jgi:hypothetical protein
MRSFSASSISVRIQPFVVAHPAQAAQVDERSADHAGYGCDGFQHDRAVAIPLGKKSVGQEAQTARDAEGDAIGPVSGRVVNVEGQRRIDGDAGCHAWSPVMSQCAPLRDCRGRVLRASRSATPL